MVGWLTRGLVSKMTSFHFHLEIYQKKYPVLYLHDGQNVFTSGFSLSGME